MSIPCNLRIGDILLHRDGRRIRFDGDLGDGELNLIDVRTGGRFRIEDTETGEMRPPSVEWLRRALIAGDIHHTRKKDPVPSDRRGDLTKLDEDAADLVDPRYSWRKTWVREAKAVGVRCEPACQAFINLNHERIAAEYFERKKRRYKKPGASTLKRWIIKDPDGFAPGALVGLAGRQKGQSQLEDAEDALVHEAALYFWADIGASIVSAHALAGNGWKALRQAGQVKLGEKQPSYEAVRLRVWSIATYSTVLAKFGKERAEKMFGAVGEAIECTRAFERVFVDGTEFEQACVFGEDWSLPGGKLKGILAIDGFSTFVFDPVIFPGPYREEMSIEALCRVMTPPDHLTDQQLQEVENVGWTFGIPETWIPDNDKTLIGPAYVPSLLDLGSRLELPETYHHDAKALVEWIGGWLKSRLRGLPGTILSAKKKTDIRRDPVDEAELTIGQMISAVRALIWEHNHTPVVRLGNRSPFQVLMASVIAHGAATLQNPHQIRAELEKTVPDRVLTDDGLEYDGIQYRGPEVEAVLRRNYRRVARSNDKAEPVTLTVTIRTNDADIDYIRVWDPELQDFVKLLSTQPSYTGLLSRWEHDEYRRMAKIRGEKYDTEGQRVAARVRSLEQIDKEAPRAAFRRRNKMFALAHSEEVRQLSGARTKRPGFLTLPEHFTIVQTSTVMRGDPGRPPAGAKAAENIGKVARAHLAPQRNAGRGISPLRGDESDDRPINPTGQIDWDRLGDVAPDDDDYDEEQ